LLRQVHLLYADSDNNLTLPTAENVNTELCLHSSCLITLMWSYLWLLH